METEYLYPHIADRDSMNGCRQRNDVKIFRDERGQATTFMALFMGLIMLGFIAFALDVGYLFQKKRMAQAAADAAAIAAAEEKGDSKPPRPARRSRSRS